jgi:hypothetical protein
MRGGHLQEIGIMSSDFRQYARPLSLSNEPNVIARLVRAIQQ